MHRVAGYAQTSVSLKATLDTGLGLLLPENSAQEAELTRRQRTLIQIATFLRRELPVRLARRVIELNNLPEGLHSMPSVQRVREWYEQSFVDIRRSRMPTDVESEDAFHELLANIYDRHAPTLVTMARGVYELKKEMIQTHGDHFQFGDLTQIHGFLDKFYMSRIGIRILIGQYLELRREEQLEGYVGLINLHTSPADVFSQAIEDAKYLCERAHGDAPDVLLQGRTDLTFSYIPSHLYYCMFELLKNSLRATCEHHGVDSDMPQIKARVHARRRGTRARGGHGWAWLGMAGHGWARVRLATVADQYRHRYWHWYRHRYRHRYRDRYRHRHRHRDRSAPR